MRLIVNLWKVPYFAGQNFRRTKFFDGQYFAGQNFLADKIFPLTKFFAGQNFSTDKIFRWTKYFAGQNFSTDKIFRRTKFFDGQNFSTDKIFATNSKFCPPKMFYQFYVLTWIGYLFHMIRCYTGYILNFSRQNISPDKIFGRQKFSTDKNFGSNPDFRHFWPPKCCPMRRITKRYRWNIGKNSHSSACMWHTSNLSFQIMHFPFLCLGNFQILEVA